MRIAIDGYELKAPMTGVGRVTDSLLRELSILQPEAEFLVMLRDPDRSYPESNVRAIPLPSDSGYFRWQNGIFRRMWRRIRPDCLLATNYTLPICPAGRTLLFVHDVSFAAHPEWYGRRQSLQRRLLVGASLRRCDLAVTDSEFSRDEILRHFRIAPDKVRVVYPGCEARFHPVGEAEVAAWKSRRGVSGRRLVGFLGSIFNRRHIPELIEAAVRLRRELEDLHVFVVGRDLTCPPLDLGPLDKSWVTRLDFLPDEELPAFYSALDAFAYLSEYEGFGLPPLEALACGTVSVLLDRASLGEVYADTAVMVDSPRPDAVADALRSVLTDPVVAGTRLARFRDLADRFSWRRAAGEVGDLIDEIIGGVT